ncbi:protein adenylyltransferase SelO [Paludibacterium denitrificans]|uniref:Protein nucleotidyltransferase YdiU n=1 Tax=Paludibacterium denitrificans TaxID=2675226 RepID=A0A844G9L2_9NEIS|nr:YdiU family protein [Paludibacterium denitrificans]MTD32472.1 YdiU family protein [Paludibacterium denitrificans]
MTPLFSVPFGQRFQTLPPAFYRPVAPTPLADPYLVAINASLSAELGIDPDSLRQPSAVAALSGSAVPPMFRPVAALYAGHQFGGYSSQLGDGRALLLGDSVALDGRVMEWQLKGAGLTPFSRMGDGRAVLRSSIREYLCSEAMHGLGIPTTRALAIMGANEPVYRETVETAAVVTRLAESFVRFGNFEVFYHRGQHDAVRQLADYVIRHHYPECAEADNPYAAMFAQVVERTASLMADWQSVGFCHGVMNTDNMSILGLTLDYGPFGFIDGFDLAHVCNHSDYAGRYAYNQQPQVAFWNLHCLASSLLPLVSEERLLEVLNGYAARYETAYLTRLRAKLGLAESQPGDAGLIEDLLRIMHAQRVDFTLLFRRLAGFDQAGQEPVRDLFVEREAFDDWAERYRARLLLESRPAAERAAAMKRVNPKYVLRNHLAELAIRCAQDDGDFSEIERLRQCLERPFDEQPHFEAYAALPPDWAGDICVSCSS